MTEFSVSSFCDFNYFLFIEMPMLIQQESTWAIFSLIIFTLLVSNLQIFCKGTNFY